MKKKNILQAVLRPYALGMAADAIAAYIGARKLGIYAELGATWAQKAARQSGGLLLIIPRLVAVAGLLLVVTAFAIKSAFGKGGAAFGF